MTELYTAKTPTEYWTFLNNSKKIIYFYKEDYVYIIDSGKFYVWNGTMSWWEKVLESPDYIFNTLDEFKAFIEITGNE